MRALVLSGGGSKGQFQVGALKHLLYDLGEQYDLLCGVSVGALVASFLAQYPLGQEKQAYKDLEELFSGVENKDIWKRWFPFGKLHGLPLDFWPFSKMKKSSFVNSKPLQELVGSKLNIKRIKKSGRQLIVGAVNLKTGEYNTFDQEHRPLSKAVLASSSFPAFFLPVLIQNDLWTDGGIRTVTPIKAAIDNGATEIDIIMCSPENVQQNFKRSPSAFDVAIRSIDIMMDQVIDDDLDKALLNNQIEGKKKIKFKVIRPDFQLNEDSLNFNPKEAKKLQHLGYMKAVEVI